MRIRAFFLAAVAAAVMALGGSPALADKYEYTAMPPEQIEKALRLENQAYRNIMRQIRQLENSDMDKASPQYKAKLESLLNEAVERKVTIDSMNEALVEQQKAYGNN